MYQVFYNEFLPLRDELYRYAYRLTRNEEDAKDLVADTYQRIWEHMARYEPGTNPMAFARVVMKRLFLNEVRSRKRRGHVEDLEEHAYHLDKEYDDHAVQFAAIVEALQGKGELPHGVLSDAVVTALDKLSEEDRFILAESLAGVKNEETAEALGMNVNTLKVRLRRIRLKLIREVESYCLEVYNLNVKRKL